MMSSFGSCCSKADDAERAAKAALHFPCAFTIKAIGKNADDLAEHTYNLVSKHDPALTMEKVQIRPSSKGKYLSVSVTVQATSREQLDAIYQELHDDDRILYTL